MADDLEARVARIEDELGLTDDSDAGSDFVLEFIDEAGNVTVDLNDDFAITTLNDTPVVFSDEIDGWGTEDISTPFDYGWHFQDIRFIEQ